MQIPARLVEKFKVISLERVAELGRLIEVLKKDSGKKNVYEKLQQLFHKYHGSAGMYGFDDISRLSEVMENAMMRLIEEGEVLDTSGVCILEEALKIIKKRVHNEKLETMDFNDLLAKIETLSK